MTKLPLVPMPLSQVPLIGETTTVPIPHAQLLCEIHIAGRMGLLMQTKEDRAVSWTPLLQVEETDYDLDLIVVRCIGRVGITRIVSSLQQNGVDEAGLRVDIALLHPYQDEELEKGDTEVLAYELAELDALYTAFSRRRDRALRLRGLPEAANDLVDENLHKDTGASSLEGTPPCDALLRQRGERRARSLDYTLQIDHTVLMASSSEDTAMSASPEQLLATFAAFDREVAGWKTRVAAMQCTNTLSRVALAKRAINWTTRRLEAEISLRAAM